MPEGRTRDKTTERTERKRNTEKFSRKTARPKGRDDARNGPSVLTRTIAREFRRVALACDLFEHLLDYMVEQPYLAGEGWQEALERIIELAYGQAISTPVKVSGDGASPGEPEIVCRLRQSRSLFLDVLALSSISHRLVGDPSLDERNENAGLLVSLLVLLLDRPGFNDDL